MCFLLAPCLAPPFCFSGALSKQMESSHEFTRKRLVEMEDTLVKKTSEMGGEVKAVQVEKCDGLLQHIQMLGIFCERAWMGGGMVCCCCCCCRFNEGKR